MKGNGVSTVELAELPDQWAHVIRIARKGSVTVTRRGKPVAEVHAPLSGVKLELARTDKIEEKAAVRTKTRAKFGQARGQIRMAADFDQPLPQLRRYAT